MIALIRIKALTDSMDGMGGTRRMRLPANLALKVIPGEVHWRIGHGHEDHVKKGIKSDWECSWLVFSKKDIAENDQYERESTR
jgi:hypothetical protein